MIESSRELTKIEEQVQKIKSELLNKGTELKVLGVAVGEPGMYAYNIEVKPAMHAHELEDLIDDIINYNGDHFAVTVLGGFDSESETMTGLHYLGISILGPWEDFS